MYYLYNQVTERTPMECLRAALGGEKHDRVPVHIYPRWAPLEYLGLNFLQAWEVPDRYVKAQHPWPRLLDTPGHTICEYR